MRRVLLTVAALLLLSVDGWAQSCDGCGIGYFRSSLPSSGGTLTGPLLLTDGTVGAPAIASAAETGTGFYRPFANYWAFATAGATYIIWGSGGIITRAGTSIGFSTNPGGSAADVLLVRDAAQTLALKNGNNDQFFRIYATNGGYWERGVNSELLTIAAAATTDTTGNLLPANAVIEAVVVRVTTVIPTAATFTVGDATTAARFATGVAVAADTTAVGLSHRQPDVAAAAGPVQTAAAKVRITPNASPGAATGVVRIEVFFSRFVAPTS